MQSESDPLDIEADVPSLYWLTEAGIIGAEALDRALEIIQITPDRQKWERFLSIVLLVLGAGFMVSGIFFFFAYNWADLHRFFKLGLLEGLVLVAVGLAYWRGLPNLSGKIALSAAALLVGAMIAVYGQVYQTGADAYQLFLTWALFISGWVLISRFTPVWLVWVLLVNLTLVNYWNQVIGTTNNFLYLALFGFNACGLLVWELAHARRVDWVQNRWSPRLLSLPAFGALVIPVIEYVTSYGDQWYKDQASWGFVTLLIFLVVSIFVFYFYAQKILDLFILVAAAFSVIITFNVWFAYAFQDLDEFLLFLISGFFIGQAALVVSWLRRVSKAWEVRQS